MIKAAFAVILFLCSAASTAPAFAQDDDIQTVSLRVHNGPRQAAGVSPMTWDTSLAARAQAWADNQRLKVPPVHIPATQLTAQEKEHLAIARASGPLATTQPESIEATEKQWYTGPHNAGIMNPSNKRLGCGTSVADVIIGGKVLARRLVVCMLAS